LYEEAIDLARRCPCDPRTLSRAARDYAKEQPAFAIAGAAPAADFPQRTLARELEG